MKKYIFNTFYTLLILSGLCLQSCTELDLTPKDAANSGTWYQTKDQFRQSLNESYREVFWPLDEVYEGMDDDWQRRDVLNAIKAGNVSSEYAKSNTDWSNLYKGIARVLVVVNELENQTVLTEAESSQLLGEANFLRASFYSYLIK